jgi:hypothetical protein
MAEEKVTITAGDVGTLEVGAAPVTKESVEKDIRAIKRWCRGPNLHTVEERWAFKKRWDAATPAEHEALLKEVIDSVKGKKHFRVRHLVLDELHVAATKKEEGESEGDREVRVRNLAFNMIHGHADSINHPVCGQDVNELIIADGKFDGEDHPVKCPKCGTIHTYSKLAEIAEK